MPKVFTKDDAKLVPILKIFEKYNIPREKEDVLCPLHNDSHYGSCKIRKKKNTAHCFACNAEIDTITFVMHQLNISFSEAVIKICEDFGISKREINPSNVIPSSKHLSKEEYGLIGLKGDMNALYYSTVEDDHILHDMLLKNKIQEKLDSIARSVDVVMEDGKPIGERGLVNLICGSEISWAELPELLELAKRQLILRILDCANKGFIEPEMNTFPSPEDMKTIWEIEDEKTREPIEVILAKRVA